MLNMTECAFLFRTFCSARVVSAFSPPSSVLCPLWPAVSTYSLWTLCTWWVQTQHILHQTGFFFFASYKWRIPGSKTQGCIQASGFTFKNLKNRLCTTAVAHCMYLLCMFSILAGSTSLSFSQPRMHHSSGRLPDQHHGLWGVCPAHTSTTLLSSWVHLQLWNRRSEVPHQHLTNPY